MVALDLKVPPDPLDLVDLRVTLAGMDLQDQLVHQVPLDHPEKASPMMLLLSLLCCNKVCKRRFSLFLLVLVVFSSSGCSYCVSGCIYCGK